ncbi:MAG: hypothetical protein MUD16_10385 [Desulfobacterales bacterium]|jgi:hypothetical protein|nr:hypothetical protein [Desulfobacterales bacterium]
MSIFWEIGLQAIEILTLVVGLLGMAMSLLLLFAPRAAQTLSGLANRSVDVEKRLRFLDKDIRTNDWIHGHPVLVGGGLAAASLFALVFFFFKVDIAEFNRIFFDGTPSAAVEIVFQTSVWVGKLACLIGLGLGAGLMAAPAKMRRMERSLNSWIDTRSWVEKLDSPGPKLDTVFFRYPIFFGIFGGALSCLLIVLSVLNLLS